MTQGLKTLYKYKLIEAAKTWSMFLLMFVFISCNSSLLQTPPKETSLSKMDSEFTKVDFRNTVKESGLYNHIAWENVYHGGGVALGDINNDGLPDLFFCGNQVSNRLYLNLGDFKFEDITKNVGLPSKHYWSSGVTMADVNHDGFLDIYVSRSGPSLNSKERRNLLLINNGDLTFSERAEDYGLADKGYSIQTAFFDYDNDGDLDAYVMNQPPSTQVEKIRDRISPQPCEQFTDRLYRNDPGSNGSRQFTDITTESGVINCAYGLGLVVSDINNDGWQDIYIANDYFVSDHLYINQQDGTYENMAKQYLKHESLYAMGCDIADFNNDGFLDIFTADMSAEEHYRSKANMPSMNRKRFASIVEAGFNHQYMFNALQLNNGNGTFSEIGHLSGVANTDWSWSALWLDLDNDTYKDLLISNGILRDVRNVDGFNKVKQMLKDGSIKLSEILNSTPSEKLSNYAFRNKVNLQFQNVTEKWGFNHANFSSGMAYGDLDGDGDLDLVVNNTNDEPYLYRNLTSNRYLRIKLKGPDVNPWAYGVKATAFYGQSKQMLELNPTRGFMSSSDPILHFGLATIEEVDSVVIRWNIDQRTVVKKVRTNQTLEVDYKRSVHKGDFLNEIETAQLFKEVQLTSIHIEECIEKTYDDFSKEILFPYKLSEIGSPLAVGDVWTVYI